MMDAIIPPSISQIHERKIALLEIRMNAPSGLRSHSTSPKDKNVNQSITSVESNGLVDDDDKNVVNSDFCDDCQNDNMMDVVSDKSFPQEHLSLSDEATTRKRMYEPITINENSNEGGSHLSDNGRNGKYSRASEDANSNIEPIAANNQDNGSRGGGPRQITLKAYFTSHDNNNNNNNTSASTFHASPPAVNTPAITSSSTSIPSASASNVIILDASPPGKEQIHPNATKKEKAAKPSSSSLSSSSSTLTKSNPSTASSQQQPSSSASNIQQLQSTVQEMRRQLDQSRALKEQADTKASRLENEIQSVQDSLKTTEERNIRLCKYLEHVYRDMAIQDARRKRDKLALDSVRLGKIITVRGGPSFNTINEQWEEGYAIKEFNKKNGQCLERREELEKRKKRLTQMKRQAKKNTTSNAVASANAVAIGNSLFASAMSASSTSNTSMIDDDEGGEFDLDLVAESEAIRFHQDQLKREEQGLAEEKKLLESEKAVHQKELKRCQNEERSRFYRDLPCLNSRYLLTSMLGRGGFSEVWKALDLLELKEVAVKVHQLNPAWTEERKASYIKHVTREYTIHRDLKHPRVVQLFDVFEIDVNSFATVLEYCKGIDLDEKLKRQRTIAEKEAKTVILQILSGLKYLNTPSAPSDSSLLSDENDGLGQAQPMQFASTGSGRRKAIIHFDLKPANILFDEMGDAKITDFGLSKIIDDVDDNTSMELTSQGAGTYWYLPPECFGKDGVPRISSKVDVWSLGIIFYQMLYGRRPFGEGKSQEKVLSEGIILNANRVDFPADPKGAKVSEEAKDFIRACLTADQRLRPDVFALIQHAFLKSSK